MCHHPNRLHLCCRCVARIFLYPHAGVAQELDYVITPDDGIDCTTEQLRLVVEGQFYIYNHATYGDFSTQPRTFSGILRSELQANFHEYKALTMGENAARFPKEFEFGIEAFSIDAICLFHELIVRT